MRVLLPVTMYIPALLLADGATVPLGGFEFPLLVLGAKTGLPAALVPAGLPLGKE